MHNLFRESDISVDIPVKPRKVRIVLSTPTSIYNLKFPSTIM